MSRRRPVIAIDPGKSGALVRSPDCRKADAVLWWRELRRKAGKVIKVEGHVDGVPFDFETDDAAEAHRAAVLAAFTQPSHLVLEGLFVPRRVRGQSPAAYMGRIRHTMALAELAGACRGSCSPLTLQRPTAAVWRPAVLGLAPNVSSAKAEELAVRVMTSRLPPIEGLGDLARNPHVAEAACMVRFGRRAAFLFDDRIAGE